MAKGKKTIAQILITLDESYAVEVQGATQDKIFALGLLEAAKITITKSAQEQQPEPSRIIVPDLVMGNGA